MRSIALALGIVLTATVLSSSAGAQDPLPTLPGPSPSAPASAAVPPAAAPAAPPTAAPPPAPAPVVAPSGIAVVALGGATDAAWPLARAVYSAPSLRPSGLDEVHARVLCGEAPPPAAPHDLRDLADSIAAVKGDDAPSRMLLQGIARSLNVRALAVVRNDGGKSTARLFLAETGTYDAASYAPDAGQPLAWSATVGSLARSFGGEPLATPPPPIAAPALATHDEPVVTTAPPR
jgi:hypothetical protein